MKYLNFTQVFSISYFKLNNFSKIFKIFKTTLLLVNNQENFLI